MTQPLVELPRAIPAGGSVTVLWVPERRHAFRWTERLPTLGAWSQGSFGTVMEHMLRFGIGSWARSLRQMSRVYGFFVDARK